MYNFAADFFYNKNLIFIDMANKKKTFKAEENVGEILSKSEKFFEEHQKAIYYVLTGIILIVLLILLGKNYYIDPKNNEAEERLGWCIDKLAIDSFQLALEGDGINAGFDEIVSSYGITKSKQAALIGAAECCYHLGRYDEAIDYAKKVSTKSVAFAPAMVGLIGDCYVEKDDLKAAVAQFEKAAKYDNSFTAPMFLKKAADIYLFEFKDNKKALELYQTIKDKYFDSQQAADIDKYIERAKL